MEFYKHHLRHLPLSWAFSVIRRYKKQIEKLEEKNQQAGKTKCMCSSNTVGFCENLPLLHMGD